ncbi:MAG: hypothetical protein IPJ61_21590 [Tessaracoccus sp.]|uniref:hypothetical protein n=1 Tax=Tessaracoccus sp. TaxID=1971211 RepID=UPI001EC918CF|nr:hypothetical protein [Tessaracoccus sp.]MBK7823583.1 hypothetical protein [Tessaracoccus sp.]
MSTIDKAALIEQAAEAAWGEFEDDSDPWAKQQPKVTVPTREAAARTLPVIAKALLAPLRELHTPIERFPRGDGNSFPMVCPECKYWGPCPTVRLLDAIEAEVQP